MKSHEDLLREREQGHLTAKLNPKRAFATKRKAKVWLARARGPIAKDHVRPYRCFVCANWHIGNRAT